MISTGCLQLEDIADWRHSRQFQLYKTNVLITSYVPENNHGSYKGDENDLTPDVPPEKRQYNVQHVKICSNVWMGEDVMVQL